jgi:hypothetical protein
MDAETKINEIVNDGCPIKRAYSENKSAEIIKEQTDAEREVFVIKRDPATGELTGKFVCCAFAPA